MVSSNRRLLKGFLTKAGKSFVYASLAFEWKGLIEGNSMISYPNYKFYFPMKAMGMFAKRYGDTKLR